MADAPGSGRHIDDLPDEVFAKILNLVPIKQVVRCAVISKRWNAASAYVIRTRESLSIGSDFFKPPLMVRGVDAYQLYEDTMREWGWFRERPSRLMDGIRPADMSLVSAMMNSLNRMEELTRLHVAIRDAGPIDICISPFIRKFAEQLTMLEVDFAVSMTGADSFPHLTRLRCRVFDANSSATFPKLAELIICGQKNGEKLPNMRMPCLKKLMIIKSYTADDEEHVREFILANAENLTLLDVWKISLQLHPAVVFPNLIQLECFGVDGAGRRAFPALTHLTVERTVTAEFLSSLPADQILSLDVDSDRQVVVSAVSKMKNLKSLMLAYMRSGEADDALSIIFDNMHHLEKVGLVSFDHRSKQGDRMIATLANQNPMLSLVSFFQIDLTDADLTSLAQLQHLTDVIIIQRDQKQKVTTAGVLTLLRGSSRNVIRNFSVRNAGVDDNQVSREISLMCEERGTTFEKDKWGDLSYFEIDV